MGANSVRPKIPPGKMTSLKRPAGKGVTLTKRMYTVPELLGLTGLTRKQVTYWDQIGLLPPTVKDPGARTGSPASFYSAADVVKALVFCDLRNAGFKPRQIRQVAKNLREHRIKLDVAENYLLTDGYSVYYASSDSEAFDILKHHRQMMMLVPIHEQVEKLRNAA
jgi:DNA-binding transcriptional MerR regulator